MDNRDPYIFNTNYIVLDTVKGKYGTKFDLIDFINYFILVSNYDKLSVPTFEMVTVYVKANWLCSGSLRSDQ